MANRVTSVVRAALINGGAANRNKDTVTVIDSDWIRSRYMMPDNSLPPKIAKNRYRSTASKKFTSTALGTNIAINAPEQFTRYSDIRAGIGVDSNTIGLSSLGKNTLGMGIYYSEAIDDNGETIFLEFGIPKFNGLMQFFTRAIDYEDSVLANTGRSTVAYNFAKIAAGFAMFVAFPIITTCIWGIKTLVSAFAGGSFDYYYMESNMPSYWGAVSNIVTQMSTELGILLPSLMTTSTAEGNIGVPVQIDKDELNSIRALLPDGMISDNNYIDIFYIATRAQRIANDIAVKARAAEEASNPAAGKIDWGSLTSIHKALDSKLTFANYLTNNQALALYKDKGDQDTVNANKNAATATAATNSSTTTADDVKAKEEAAEAKKTQLGVDIAKDKANQVNQKKKDDGSYTRDADEVTYTQKFLEGVDASFRDGGSKAVFRVDYSGSVSESISNSTGSIGIESMIKNVGGKVRDLKFDLAGGNLTAGMDTVVGYARDVAAGLLDSVSFGLSSVLATMTGGGFVDIPKKWEDSEISFPTITYKIKLISSSGDTFSKIQNIYIPLAMLLAGALPQSTGPASYTSPFLCSLFNKGVQNIKLGMITSMSIERGTSNLGFDKFRRPLAIDVSFTVTDFSKIMTAPISMSIFSTFKATLNDNSPLGNYIATLASRDIMTSKYFTPKAKIAASRLMMGIDGIISPNALSLRIGTALNKTFGGMVADGSLTAQYLNNRP